MQRLVPKILGIVCIVAGLGWSLLFPKGGYFLRPDFVASVAIGLGLIIPGIIMLFITKARALPSILAILLVWSVLLNACLFSWAYEASVLVRSPAALKSDNGNINAAATNNGNYWKSFSEWEVLMKGKNGMPKDEAKAGQILPQLIKGVYLVKFAPAEGFNPQTPGEFLQTFNKTSSLRSSNDGVGGASFFRTKRENNKLTASFLTEQPDKMKQDIEKNPQLKFVSVEEVTPEKFIAHVKSAQESLKKEPK